MRTKAYIKLIEEGVAAGEIPDDIGREILGLISERGKMTPQIYSAFTSALAERGLYNVYTTPFNRNPPPVSGDYRYESRNVFFLLYKGLILAVFNTLGRLVARVAFRLKVKGRKNLKRCKGAVVTVSNHFSYLDILATRCATGWRSLRFVVAPHNAGGKSAPGRGFFTGAGAVAVGTTMSGARNFNAYLDKCVNDGKTVHFYAERAMWLNYPEPRPFLAGAFTLAARHGIPVVPVFYAYGKNGKLRRTLHMHAPITAYVLAPVLPDMSLAVKQRAAKLCDNAQDAVRKAYEEHCARAAVK